VLAGPTRRPPDAARCGLPYISCQKVQKPGPGTGETRMNLGGTVGRVKTGVEHGNLPEALLYTHPGWVRIDP